MPNPYSKEEIISAVKESASRSLDWFKAIPASEFFHREGEVWSVSDNVDHLIKAINPISKAMRLSKVALHSMFGKPERGSKSYTEICSIYQAKIAKGAVAAGSFLPKQEDPVNPAESKNALLEKLSRSFDKLVAAIEKCEDETLDQIQLPHPLIGNLTVREMLFFTIYHTLRHASQEGD